MEWKVIQMELKVGERGKYFRDVYINIVWTDRNVIMRVRLLCYTYVRRQNEVVVTSIRDNDRMLSVNGI